MRSGRRRGGWEVVGALFGVLQLADLASAVGMASQGYKQLKIKGKIMVGGLFPVHGDGAAEGKACGQIKGDKGIQRLEAMLHAIDKINNDPNMFPYIHVDAEKKERKLGVHILDTCSQDAHALEQTMEFIKTAIKTTTKADKTGLYKCGDGSSPTYNPPDPIVAVIGAASSSVSAMVANMLRLFEIPQISYSSTSADLSDKNKFTFFSRVVPSDSLQAMAMVDVVEMLGWKYVHAIFDEGTYGEKGIESFKRLALDRGICMASNEKIKAKYQHDKFVEILQRLREKKETRGVVMFVNEDSARKILKAAKAAGMVGWYVWIASDSWGRKRAVLSEGDEAAHGAITIEPKKTVLKEFDDYFVKLIPEAARMRLPDDDPRKKGGHDENPWLEEFWEHKFNCSTCDGDLSKTHNQEGYVPFVYDAVYTLAHAMDRMIREKCARTGGRRWGKGEAESCGDSIPGHELLGHIRNISFESIQGANVVLDMKGDRIGEYNLFQYDSHEKDYVYIGEWVNQGLKLENESSLGLAYEGGKVPRSVCSRECENRTQYKMFVEGEGRCCWICRDCNASSILPNDTACIPCEIGFLPNSFKNECIPMIPETLEWTSLWAIVPAVFAVLGIAATCVVIYTFVKYNKTPIIMASGRELCYFMISGILCSYTMTFVLVNPPSPLTCGILRLGLGLFMCIIYAAILTKTSRLARVFTGEIKTVQRPRFITPKAQVGICGLIISVQMVGAVVWMGLDPPRTIHIYPDRLRAVLSCQTGATQLLLSLSYDMLLIILCTVYAFKMKELQTRKIPENFNETKYIGFTMYATCIVWLAFIPIYFATYHNFRIQTTSLCMCISISGTVTLCCFFAPKVYIVLFQPWKNVRERAMTNFQKLVAHHMNTQMRFVNHLTPNSRPNEMDKMESQVSQVTYSVVSTASVNAEPRGDVERRSSLKTGGGLLKANGGRAPSLLPPPSLSPMPESSPTTLTETAEIAPISSSPGDTELDPGENDLETSEDVPFLPKDSMRLAACVDDLELEDPADEIFRDSPTDLLKKESWLVADARAEVELILSEIATQEGTVV